MMAAATTGLMGTSDAATIYNEISSGDLSNAIGSPTVLGNDVRNAQGSLTDNTDLADHFNFRDLTVGYLATFNYGFSTDPTLAVSFTFSDPGGGTLATFGPASGTGNGSTSQVVVPAGGQIRVSVVSSQAGSVEGFPTTSWNIGVTQAVPEPSGAALVALGSLLALRRRRD